MYVIYWGIGDIGYQIGVVNNVDNLKKLLAELQKYTSLGWLAIEVETHVRDRRKCEFTKTYKATTPATIILRNLREREYKRAQELVWNGTREELHKLKEEWNFTHVI